VDRQDFLQTLAEACQETGFQVHAYCLMRNRFHSVEHHSGELKRERAEAKLALAARVRRETTQTLGWIANRVHMGTRKSFSAKLHRRRKAQEKAL
jgi:hypothetical protein